MVQERLQQVYHKKKEKISIVCLNHDHVMSSCIVVGCEHNMFCVLCDDDSSLIITTDLTDLTLSSMVDMTFCVEID